MQKIKAPNGIVALCENDPGCTSALLEGIYSQGRDFPRQGYPG